MLNRRSGGPRDGTPIATGSSKISNQSYLNVGKRRAGAGHAVSLGSGLSARDSLPGCLLYLGLELLNTLLDDDLGEIWDDVPGDISDQLLTDQMGHPHGDTLDVVIAQNP